MATGRAVGERIERARALRELIGADSSARDAFDGAYAGHGPAIGALEALLHGDAIDPGRDASLERRRRSAFARPDGPADEAAAAAALVSLRREEERADADSAALDHAITVVLERDAERRAAEGAAAELSAAMAASDPAADASASAASDPAESDPAESDPAAPQTRRWIRPVLAAAVIVAAIGLGAGGESLVSGALAPPEPASASPSPITYFRDPAARDPRPVGDTEAADRWFDGEQTAEDAYPAPFEGIDPVSTRLVHTGTDGLRAWVGRGTDSEYCVLTYSGQMGGAGCTLPEAFVQAGAMVSTGGITITWTGADLTVKLSH